MATLYPRSGMRVTDTSGRIVASARLLFYVSESISTGLTVYQDADATTPHANPVVCDAGGLIPPIYLTDGLIYKVVCQNADGSVTFWTHDPDNGVRDIPRTPLNVAALKALPSAALQDNDLASVLQYGTAERKGGGLWAWDAGSTDAADDVLVVAATDGGAGRWKLVVPAGGTVSLYQGGAIGNSNGTSGNGTDDLAAIQRTLNACAGKYRVEVPQANFRVSDVPDIPSTSALVGANAFSCRIITDYLGYKPGARVKNRSFVNVKGVGFTQSQDVRDLEVNITAISQANPAQVTAAGHGLTTGQNVYIKGVGGMVELVDSVYAVTVIDADNVTLTGINSTGYTAFTSGGTIRPDWSGYSAAGIFIHDGSQFVTVEDCDFQGPYERHVEVLNSDHFIIRNNTGVGAINSFCRIDSDEVMVTVSLPVADTNILQPLHWEVSGNRAHGGASWTSTTPVSFYFLIAAALDNAADKNGRFVVADNDYQYFQFHGVNVSGSDTSSWSVTGNRAYKILSSGGTSGFAYFLQTFLGGPPTDGVFSGNVDEGSYVSYYWLGTSGVKIANVTFGANVSKSPVRNPLYAVHVNGATIVGGSYCGATAIASAGVGDGMRFESCANIAVIGPNVCDNTGTSITSDSNCSGIHVIVPITDGNGTDAPSLGGSGNSLFTDASNLLISDMTVSGTGVNVRFSSDNANMVRLDLSETLGGYLGSPAANQAQIASGSGSGGIVRVTASGVEILNIPSSNPGGSNRVWKDSGALKIT